jgi:2'-5' RNA ligase
MGASAYSGARQLAFEFVRTLPAPIKRVTDNLYFAVLPDADAANRMTEVGRELWDRHRLPGRVHPQQLLHISLMHLGNYAGIPPHVVAEARSVGSAVRCSPFEVHFDRVIHFENRRGCQVVMRCSEGDAGFGRLRSAITTAMIRSGIRPGRAIGLTPHVTLIYKGRPVPETVLAEPIIWTVREFVLVHSLYGRGRHIHLGRWPLCG